MPPAREPVARACRPRPGARSIPHLGCDRSGTLEYFLSGAHIYALAPGVGAPRRIAPLRSPNRAALASHKGAAAWKVRNPSTP